MAVPNKLAVNHDYSPSSCIIEWTIEKVSTLNEENHFSPIFTIGPHKWRLLAFRRGSNVDDYLSVYVVAEECTNYRYAKFSITIVGQTNKPFRKGTEDSMFTENESDWGFDNFIKFKELIDPSNGYIIDDACTIEVELYLHSTQDSIEVIYIEDRSPVMISTSPASTSGYLDNNSAFICAFCHVSEASGSMLHIANGKEVEEGEVSGPNVVHVHQKCLEGVLAIKEPYTDPKEGCLNASKSMLKVCSSTERRPYIEQHDGHTSSNGHSDDVVPRENGPSPNHPSSSVLPRINSPATTPFDNNQDGGEMCDNDQDTEEEGHEIPDANANNKESGRDDDDRYEMLDDNRDDDEGCMAESDTTGGYKKWKRLKWVPPTTEILKSPRAEQNPECEHAAGQPKNPSLLIGYKYHIAKNIWETKTPKNYARNLRLLHHHKLLAMWKLEKEDEHVQEYVRNSVFQQLILFTHKKVDKVLVNAFQERFYPETNTFHLPFGEMTITINDVYQILGLPVEGKAVGRDLDEKSFIWDKCYELCRDVLGLDRETCAKDVFNRVDEKGNVNPRAMKSFKLEWLRKYFQMHGNHEPRGNKHVVAAYLLYVIGSVILGDHSGNRVSAVYLHCLTDLDKVHEYSWGTACLSHLYMNLGKGSRWECAQLGGNMTLLTVWIYEHFGCLHRSCLNKEYQQGQIKAAQYSPLECSKTSAAVDDLISLREKIDDLRVDQVTWDPYKMLPHGHRFQPCSLYSGPIVCFDTVSMYYPERVLRQFGFVQTIPPDVWSERSKSKPKMTPREFPLKHINGSNWSCWSAHCLSSLNLRKVPEESPGDAVEGYIDWYYEYSHPFVANTKSKGTHRSDESTLKEHIDMLHVRIKTVHKTLSSTLGSTSAVSSSKMEKILEMLERASDPTAEDLFLEEDTQTRSSTRWKKRARMNTVAR